MQILFVFSGILNIILSAHISGIAKSMVSLPGIVVNLNNNESNIIYFSASISTLFIAAFF